MELVRRYSNRADLQEVPEQARLRAFARNKPLDEPLGGSVRGREPLVVRDRLSEEDVQEISWRFRAGTPKHVLATEFKISISSIKLLLRTQ